MSFSWKLLKWIYSVLEKSSSYIPQKCTYVKSLKTCNIIYRISCLEALQSLRLLSELTFLDRNLCIILFSLIRHYKLLCSNAGSTVHMSNFLWHCNQKCCWSLWLPLARNMRDGIRRAHQGFWCISWLWYCLDAVLGRSRWKRRSKGNKQCCLYGKFWGWSLDIKRVVATIYSKPLPLLEAD